MDPDANLEQQLELARAIIARADAGGEVSDQEIELAERVIALHEWLVSGGFLPSDWQREYDPQILAVTRLMKDHGRGVYISTNVFDLPDGYWLARWTNGFECGIAPDGSVSS